MLKYIIGSIMALVFISCQSPETTSSSDNDIDRLAEKYIRLGLTIGMYDPVFIDAYYGPDSLKPTTEKLQVFPKDSILAAVDTLYDAFNNLSTNQANDTLARRAKWIAGQLQAFRSRIKIFSGENPPFDQETRDLFGVTVPFFPEGYYQNLVGKLDSLLPGKGSIPDRFQALANRFIIPKNKLDTVFKASIAECRKRTLAHFQLPANENFTLEFVNNKPWNGYNWYKGNYTSLIQINTDLDIFIEKAIDVGSHESYPGHHVYNMLLEKNLYREKGWIEISMYPLFSPQSLIAEGTANYGIDVCFPGNEKNRFAKEVLLPLAGLDTAGLDLYFRALDVKGQLNFVRNDVARNLLGGKMDDSTAVRWLMDYGLYNRQSALKGIDFIKLNRSYVINYNYGMTMVKRYIETRGGTADNPQKRWELFKWILSNPVTPADLLVE